MGAWAGQGRVAAAVSAGVGRPWAPTPTVHSPAVLLRAARPPPARVTTMLDPSSSGEPLTQRLAGYDDLLRSLKARIRAAQGRAALAVNRQVVLLYWEIGQAIRERQQAEGWGARVIDRLAADLRRAFPDMKGFSPRNLKYMRAFAEAYPERPFVQQVAAQIPWFHHCVLLDKLPSPDEREWYIRKTIEHSWSRNVLVHQIESRLHLRQGRAPTNFSRALPTPDADLAQQVLKDPYVFDFLSLGEAAHERGLERSLLLHLRDFLLELGVGFAFVGSQVHLEIGDEDYFLDLLFYHLKLRRYVVIDLKMGTFQPEFAGKMNFYLSAVDDRLRHAQDASSLGIILCKSSNRLVVEYALRGVEQPMGVSTYQLAKALPKQLEGSLPTVEQLEAGLDVSSVGATAAEDIRPAK